MKSNTLLIACLLSLFLGCTSKKCPPVDYNSTLATRNGIIYINKLNGIEKDVSKNGNLETVKVFDSCNQNQELYAYQRLRISKDSTVLNGFYKTFYPNGQLRALFHFKNGEIEGESLLYNTKGVLLKKEFRYWGSYIGPQYEYDSTGELKKVYFMTNDTDYWFLVRYNNVGKIDEMKGQVYTLMARISSNLKIGDGIRVYLELPRIDNTHLSVHYTLSNNQKKLLDTTLTRFDSAHNSLFSGITHQFTPDSKGVNTLNVIVKLMDNTNNKLLKADSFSKVILVN